jgi:excisionase family DNA binding protein
VSDPDLDLDFETREWLTIRQTALLLQVSTRSIYRAIRRHELRAKAINDRGDLRTSRAWVSEWMSSGSGGDAR